jgi:hypothetical protein
VDLVQGAVEELERLHKSNQNREKQSSFLELCQGSDPRGTMIHWNGWSIDDDQQAHQSPPCHHPQHEYFKHVAVIDYATGTECDCPGDCTVREGLRYCVGVGTIDCLGGEGCKCCPDKVMVAVTRWLPHSLMNFLGHVEVDPVYEAPPGQGVNGKREDGESDMWWMELVEAMEKEVYEMLFNAKKKTVRAKKGGGKGKNGEGKNGEGEDSDTTEDSYYSEHSEGDHEEEDSPSQKRQKTRQTGQTVVFPSQRATRSSARAQQ